MQPEDKLAALLTWVKAHTPDNVGILVPISGGTDSALSFYLYATAFPERTLGVFFGEHLRAEEWFRATGTVKNLPAPVSKDPEVTRFAELLLLALEENRMLIGTRNRTEGVLGTYSLASRVGIQYPLSGVWKADVLALCEAAGVPREVIESSRAADPVCGRPEELAKMPFADVDAFAKMKLGLDTPPPTLSSDQLSYLEELYARGSFKQHLPVLGAIV